MGLIKSGALKRLTPELKKVREEQERMKANRQVYNQTMKSILDKKLDYRLTPDAFDTNHSPRELRRMMWDR